MIFLLFYTRILFCYYFILHSFWSRKIICWFISQYSQRIKLLLPTSNLPLCIKKNRKKKMYVTLLSLSPVYQNTKLQNRIESGKRTKLQLPTVQRTTNECDQVFTEIPNQPNDHKLFTLLQTKPTIWSCICQINI